jgi:DNA-directed RNA polymerase specialized sigma24 family protein
MRQTPTPNSGQPLGTGAEVIVLRHLQGLNLPQVAERMNRSDDSVQKLWVRPLANLRKSLDPSL